MELGAAGSDFFGAVFGCGAGFFNRVLHRVSDKACGFDALIFPNYYTIFVAIIRFLKTQYIYPNMILNI